MAKGFYTDGMTVEQILAIPPSQLNKLSERDLSRALRTVALAANKRLDRLMQNVKVQDGSLVLKKSAKHKIATDAVNKLYEEAGKSKKAMRFGVGGKTRNQMYAELMRAKGFMGLKTSKVREAVKVRKTREARLFGKTAEDIRREAEKDFRRNYYKTYGKQPNKKEVEKVGGWAEEEYQKEQSNIWTIIRHLMEIPQIRANYGSDEVIEYVAMRVSFGGTEEEIKEELINKALKTYEELIRQREQEEEDFMKADGLDMDGEDWDDDSDDWSF